MKPFFVDRWRYLVYEWFICGRKRKESLVTGWWITSVFLCSLSLNHYVHHLTPDKISTDINSIHHKNILHMTDSHGDLVDIKMCITNTLLWFPQWRKSYYWLHNAAFLFLWKPQFMSRWFTRDIVICISRKSFFHGYCLVELRGHFYWHGLWF